MAIWNVLLAVTSLTPVLVLCTVIEITEMDVSKYCINEDTYVIDGLSIYNLTWKGDFPKGKWFPCKFTFKPENDGDDLCVTPEVFEMPHYITKLQYYKNSESQPDKTFNAVNSPGTGDYCVWVDKLHIVFDCSGGIIRSEIAGSYVSLKVWAKEGNHGTIVNVGLIIGLSVLALFIICAVITVVVICKCYRRQGARGFIHHTLSEVNAPGNHQYPSAMVSPYGAGMQQTASYPITSTQTPSTNMPTMGVSAPYLAQDMYAVAGPTVANTERPWPPQNQNI